VGDVITLTLADGSPHTAKDYPFKLSNGLYLSYGEISGLGGDFYGTKDPISDGSTEEEQRNRFTLAFNTLDATGKLQPGEARDILKILQIEVDAVNAALYNHEDPSVAYSKLTDQWFRFWRITWWRSGPGYLGLAKINWDHFGVDARTAYNAGHAVALDEAVKDTGDLERAYIMNAFADHFLEDSFSAGHLRTPRRPLHSDSWINSFPDWCAKVQ
jgi:hypothetical protein